MGDAQKLHADECNPSYCRTAAHPGALKAGAAVLGVCLGYAVSPPCVARQDMKIHTPTHALPSHTHTHTQIPANPRGGT